MRIAILGTRGVPPRYGGFETFAAELSVRLVERGHEVDVYCRSGLYPDGEPTWRGVRRIDLPAIRHKYLETVSHAALSALDAIIRRHDAVLVCNAANAFVLPLFLAASIPAAINVDGIERNRKKWNALGRAVYHTGEAFSASFGRPVVADADVIASYYRQELMVEPVVIPYGAELESESSDVLERLGIEARRYLLYVSRFEPENHPLEVALEYGKVRSDLPLVMVGDAPYAAALKGQLHATADPRVRFPGALYGNDYATLQRNALLYIQATEIGGTHPALIEAMGSGGAVLANGTPENREVGGEDVVYFDIGASGSLAGVIEQMLENRESLEAMRSRARARVARLYSWDSVTDRYERLFFSMTGALS